jgi:hypothetical protein
LEVVAFYHVQKLSELKSSRRFSCSQWQRDLCPNKLSFYVLLFMHAQNVILHWPSSMEVTIWEGGQEKKISYIQDFYKKMSKHLTDSSTCRYIFLINLNFENTILNVHFNLFEQKHLDKNVRTKIACRALSITAMAATRLSLFISFFDGSFMFTADLIRKIFDNVSNL